MWKAFLHRWSRGLVDLEVTKLLQLPSLDKEIGLSPGNSHMQPAASSEELLALVSSTLVGLSKGGELCHWQTPFRVISIKKKKKERTRDGASARLLV